MKNNIVVSDLEIIFIYLPSEGGYPVSFVDLAVGSSSLEIADYEPDNFWNCGGGFQVTINGFNTILNCTKFYALPNSVSLLIRSLDYLPKSSLRDDRFQEITHDFIDYDFIEIISSDKYVSLSYLPKEQKKLNKRGGHYFKGLLFERELWYNASTIALDEYFVILERVLEINKKETKRAIPLMKNQLDYWNKVKIDLLRLHP